jgi:8-oxo-dGTP pyrophosphatase MutT (NUDIX family)
VAPPGRFPILDCPGGGVETRESDERALRRELLEELGIVDPDLGPCIWTREFTFPWRDAWWHQHERYYVVGVESSEIREGEEIENARWWSAEEIAASDELFAPARLAELLHDLAAHGPPPAPVDVGI